MRTAFELYATGDVSPDAVWSTVGDPWNLPLWTDAEGVLDVGPEPVAPGTEIVVAAGGAEYRWRVRTAESRLLEATTVLDGGAIGVGVRVVGDPRGSRIILAGAIDSPGAWRGWKARLIDAPAWRRRFDRWSQAALRAARCPPTH